MIDPSLRLSVRGLEPGPCQGTFLRSVHAVDRDRPVHGTARQRGRGHRRHAVSLKRAGSQGSDSPGPESTGGSIRPSVKRLQLAGQLPRPGYRQTAGPARLRSREAQDPRCLRPGARRGDLEGTFGQRVDRRRKTRTAKAPSNDPPNTAGIISTARWPLLPITPRSSGSWTSSTSAWSWWCSSTMPTFGLVRQIDRRSFEPRRSRTSPASRSSGRSSKISSRFSARDTPAL